MYSGLQPNALDGSNQVSQRVWSPEAQNKVRSVNRILPNLWSLLVITRYEITGGVRKWLLKQLYRPQDG